MSPPALLGPAPLRPRRLAPGVVRVWLLTAGLAGLAATLFAAFLLPKDGLATPFHIQWWGLVPMFYAAEAIVLPVHFRREPQSFSLGEVPLVLGLFYSPPAELVAALVVGSALALMVHRKQSRVRLVFNLAHLSLGAVVAVLVFHRVVITDPLGPEGWFGAVLATVVATLIGHSAITTAVVISGGHEREALPQVLVFGLAATLANTSLALAAVAMAWSQPRTVGLLALPTVALFLTYRAYLLERRRHEGLDFLYESTRLLYRSPEVESALIGLLDQLRLLFRAERAEMCLLGAHEGEKALRSSIGPGGAAASMARVDL
ncbi:MAG: hypothetical protein ACRD0D_00215, partial [Acidimicrobiales bacterium]